MDEWHNSTVGEFCPFIYGKALPERMRRSGDVAVISSAGVTGTHDTPLIDGRGIVIGRKGTVGSVTFSHHPFWAIDTAFYISDEPKKRDLRFTYYLLQTLNLPSMNSDSAVPGLNRDNAHAKNIRVPSINEQQAIATTLGALDDKIDLNRQLNETLEQTARALFRDWFVDFGPTKAKMEGQEAYLKGDLWDLFPERLNEAGVPEGWTSKPLDQIADFLNGLALQKYPADGEDDLPAIKIAELRSGVTEKSGKASRKLPEQYIVSDGDVLFSWSGSLTHLVWTGGEGALNQHLFKVTSTSHPKWFFYFWIAEHMPDFQATAASKATTMGHIQRRHLTAAQTFVPTNRFLEMADSIIGPLFDRMLKNSLESRTLTHIRDLLLPKLMSGELETHDPLTEGVS